MSVHDDVYASKNPRERPEASSLTFNEKGKETDGRFEKSWVVDVSLKRGLKGCLFNDETLTAYNKSMFIR